MKILLVYPETPVTFWSFKDALRFISKKSAEPPLGLLTIAAMLPVDWDKKLIDMNVSPLKDEQIRWADYLFLTGMNIHKCSFKKVMRRSNELNTPVVAGGPMVTTDYEEFLGVDHFVLNEAEATLPPFLNDLRAGKAKHIYTTKEFPEITHTPVPLWHLLEKKKYGNMSIQYSRGCPYNCEFCSITMLNGHRPRTKSTEQFLAELTTLFDYGWRGSIFVVDDNFIGNKKKIKNELLPALIEWSKQHHYPFEFGTETSINLADDDRLIKLMAEAGFNHTFIGIETPNDESLAECGKTQNLKQDLLPSIKKLHKAGLRVSGGFIIGFDHDLSDIFEQQIRFIRNSGIVTAMVGLLNAPAGTRLFERLKKENRLLSNSSGNNMDGSINFIPKMKYQTLIAGYKRVLETIYSPKEYYERVKTFLTEYQSTIKNPVRITFSEIKALFKSMWFLGVLEKGKQYYWKLFFLSLFKYPKKFPMAITLAIYGFHFRQVVKTT
ncbi:MAG TPA: DUF4070 domain-containing protein [Bacteroidetes bacterium]|nr:DUF4070 domain-containing protein [Bacteroidota bacterium]